MRRLILVLMAGLVVGILGANISLAKEDEEKIPKGLKTKTTIIYKYKKIKDGEYQKTLYSKHIERYDKKENKVEWAWYKSDGSLFFKDIQKYDEKGNEIEGARIGWPNTKWVCKYDEKGNRVERLLYKANGKLDHRNSYKYNERGDVIENNYYSDFLADEPYHEKTTYKYKYNANGNKIEKLTYYENGTLSDKETYKYNKKGNLIKWAKCNSGGIILDIKTYKYDESGNMIEEVGHHPTWGTMKTVYKYNKQRYKIEAITHNIIKTVDADKKTPKSKRIYEYEFYPESKENK